MNRTKQKIYKHSIIQKNTN